MTANLEPAPAPTTRELLKLALYYGVAGFGGGYSILAQMRRDLVHRRRWMNEEEFFVLAELSKSLPGTAATSLVALLGQRVGGSRRGAFAACAFLVPSMVLMTACGAAYGAMRSVSHLSTFFDGMNAAMIGVVASVTLDLGRAGLKSRGAVLAAAVCGLLLTFRVISEPALAAAAVAFGAARGVREAAADPNGPGADEGFGFPVALGGILATSGALASLVRVFVPIGVVTFGGGLAMIPAIEHTVVIEQHWLDAKAFADAVALGQITPGPVAICATFIGYRVAGVLGAFVATVAMFGPAIALALVAGRYVRRFGSHPIVRHAFTALAPAVIGMLAAATVSLGRASLNGVLEAVLALATFLLLLRFKVSPLWPLLGCGIVRLAVTLV